MSTTIFRDIFPPLPPPQIVGASQTRLSCQHRRTLSHALTHAEKVKQLRGKKKSTPPRRRCRLSTIAVGIARVRSRSHRHSSCSVQENKYIRKENCLHYRSDRVWVCVTQHLYTIHRYPITIRTSNRVNIIKSTKEWRKWKRIVASALHQVHGVKHRARARIRTRKSI